MNTNLTIFSNYIISSNIMNFRVEKFYNLIPFFYSPCLHKFLNDSFFFWSKCRRKIESVYYLII